MQAKLYHSAQMFENMVYHQEGIVVSHCSPFCRNDEKDVEIFTLWLVTATLTLPQSGQHVQRDGAHEPTSSREGNLHGRRIRPAGL
jgi:hypothetical protein